jgi:tRNA (guanosine-2'-O-)-methyltransferase
VGSATCSSSHGRTCEISLAPSRPLGDLPAERRRTVAVLGHEHSGIPAEAFNLIDAFVEIPMVGTGTSVNVAVAGSLVLHRLAGLL